MEKLAQWRTSANAGTWKAVAKKFNDAGIDVALLCYNMQDSMKDEDIEYGFAMAKGLGVKAITTSTTLTMAKRIAPIADKHKLMVGYHGHDATSDPNQTATLESYDTLMAYGKYNGINLDIGHFTAAGVRCGGVHPEAPRQDHQLAREGPQEEPRSQRGGVGHGRYAHQGSDATAEEGEVRLPGEPGAGVPDSGRLGPSSPRRRSASRT